MTNIRGRRDGPNRRNEHYDFGSQKNIPRVKMVAIVKEQGLGANIIKVKGKEYVRDNPDNSKKDNVNRGK